MELPNFLTESAFLRDQALASREAARAKQRRSKDSNTADAPFACLQGLANQKLNRYADVLPYDRTQLQLPRCPYINANWIQEPVLVQNHSSPLRTWIASQAPMDHTCGDFLSILTDLEPAPRIILQLTPLVERGMSKCAPYVPPLDTTWRFPTSSDPNRCILITRKSIKEQQSFSTYTLSELDIQASDHSSRRQVYHYELLDWPDHGVPADPSSLTTLIRDVHHQHAQLDPSLTEPVLVHCSAGVGRTGTFISLSALLHQMSDLKQAISQNNWPQEINPVDVVVDKIRDQRVMMVQTLQQLLFVRMAFKEAWLADAVAAQLTDPDHT